MPPQLALFLTVICITFLFRKESQLRPQVTAALWIPTIWLSIVLSRPVSLWFGGGIILNSPDASLDGSPVDAAIFLILIVTALIVLSKRAVSVSQFFARNVWLSLFLLYALVSIIWSDIPAAASKRWIKSCLGNVVMCLVIFSEQNPALAIKTVARRCAYLLLPASILLIKYYPSLGTSFGPWGDKVNTGVGLNKNYLGYLCLVLGYVIFWEFLEIWKQRSQKRDRTELYVYGFLLWMVFYLFAKARSMTALGSFIIAVAVLVMLPLFKKITNHLGKIVVLAFLIFLPFVSFISPDEFVSSSVEITGHETTFWGRVELWKDILSLKTNAVIGTGYESFWNSKMVEKLWETRWWKPTEAHNGYLETYINLGGIGVFLLITLLIFSFRKIQSNLLTNFHLGTFRLGFLIATIFYNVTEAAFKGMSPVWFLFLFVAIDPPKQPSIPHLKDITYKFR